MYPVSVQACEKMAANSSGGDVDRLRVASMVERIHKGIGEQCAGFYALQRWAADPKGRASVSDVLAWMKRVRIPSRLLDVHLQ